MFQVFILILQTRKTVIQLHGVGNKTRLHFAVKKLGQWKKAKIFSNYGTLIRIFPHDEDPTVDRSAESAALLQMLSSPANPQGHSDNHTPATTFKLFTLPIQCAYFTYNSPKNSDYFPTKHSQTGLYTSQEVRILQYDKTNVTAVFISRPELTELTAAAKRTTSVDR